MGVVAKSGEVTAVVANGLDLRRLETPAGETRSRASSRHQVGIHAGRPVRATCRCDGRTQRRLQSRGDIDIIPAGLSGVWVDDRASTVLLVRVSVTLLQSAAEELGIYADRIELVPKLQARDIRLERVAWALEAELDAHDSGDQLYRDSLAMAFAARLVRQHGSAPAILPCGGLSRPKLARAIDYIEGHLDQRLSLVSIAKSADMGVSHFKTLFKRSTGLPVHRYVVRSRVERARQQLTSGASGLATVAAACGFADQSHMARCMRREIGVTPGQILRARR